MDERIKRANASLLGLSVGDAFGEQFIIMSTPMRLVERSLPPAPWKWTDDTHMALSVVETLIAHDRIDRDHLAGLFAERFRQEPDRGYAGGAKTLLGRLVEGHDWRIEARALFDGGSWGNGGAMRAAPIGAYFSKQPADAARGAARAAEVTHAHDEGQVAAIAVAVAACFAEGQVGKGSGLIEQVLPHVPSGKTRERMVESVDLPGDDVVRAYRELGTGKDAAGFDTAPFCVWMAAHHGADFADAMWKTVAGMGDRDTTCAIVGGIIAAGGVEPPADWVAATEPLPTS